MLRASDFSDIDWASKKLVETCPWANDFVNTTLHMYSTKIESTVFCRK